MSVLLFIWQKNACNISSFILYVSFTLLICNLLYVSYSSSFDCITFISG